MSRVDTTPQESPAATSADLSGPAGRPETEALRAWLKAEKGRAKRLAAFLRITEGGVSQYLQNGVPADRIRQICEFSGGELTLDDLVPGKRAAAAGDAVTSQA